MAGSNVRAWTAARVAFAIGVAGLGLLSLAYGNFAPEWQSVPSWLPWPHGLAYATGVVLLAGGIGLLVARIAVPCALAVTACQLFWVLLRSVPVARHITSIGHWQGFCEGMALLGGCWILWAHLARSGGPGRIPLLDGERAMRVARILFGVSCVAFGLAHFAYAQFTAELIPACFPARLPLAYATGVFHVAAGLGILSTVLARLAATLEAIMLGCFVLVVHIPSVVATSPLAWAPSPQVQWTELLISWVLAACAGLVSASLRDRPWGLR